MAELAAGSEHEPALTGLRIASGDVRILGATVDDLA